MDIIHTIILGIVEGATEFLPVSSTGHLILVSKLLAIPDSTFLSTFEIAIQCGAILAVVVLYWRSFLNWELLKRIVVAFIPTAVIGLLVYPFIKGYLLGNALVVVIALFVGGIALIVFEYFHTERQGAVSTPEAITYRQAIAIGFFQAIAVIPGVSRSAATILGGLSVGVRRIAIVEFSFLLAVPTMAAATGLDLLKSYKSITSADLGILLLGTAVAFVVALAVIRFFLSYVRRHTFIPFGVYRIILALVFFFLVLR
ncbi:MAG: undecaprenyl-diphosphate phosphatase [Patescibacteria group bacterium]